MEHSERDVYELVDLGYGQCRMVFATVAILVPSVLAETDGAGPTQFSHTLSLGLSVLLIITYALGLLFSLKTHRALFSGRDHAGADEAEWSLGLALATLAGVTVLVALVSELFVESVQQAVDQQCHRAGSGRAG